MSIPTQAEIGRVYRPALGDHRRPQMPSPAARATKPVDARAGRAGAPSCARATRGPGRRRAAGPLNLGDALQALEKALPEDTIFTTDAGNFATWPTRFMHVGRHRTHSARPTAPWATACPPAIGAKIVQPERPVIAFVGDGGFLMTGQEIATAFHHGAAIVVCLNNGMYGTIRMHQERHYPGRVSGTELTNPDFARSRELRRHGEVVERTEDFARACGARSPAAGPRLLHLRIDPEAITPARPVRDPRSRRSPGDRAP